MALRCLDALGAAADPATTETIVVANGTDPDQRALLEDREDIILVRSSVNLGFGGGNNLAAGIARGRFLLFLNDDSRVGDAYLDHLLATAATDKSIGAVAGRILSVDGSLQEAGSVLWNDGNAAHVGLGLPAGTGRFTYRRDVDYASANGMLVRRTAWDQVGGFDERYFPAYYEDVDLCLSLREHGYRVVYEPRAELQHLESQSTSSQFRRFLLERNRRLLVEKWSSTLDRFAPPPADPWDAGAIEHAVHRARGSPRRLLVVESPGCSLEDAPVRELVERLAATGWAVTVAGPPPPSRPRTGARARWADLGIDRPGQDVDRVLALPGPGFEVAVVGNDHPAGASPLLTADGSVIPVVRAGTPADRDIRSLIELITQAAPPR
jgi:GT2 family glycosyltransferase